MSQATDIFQTALQDVLYVAHFVYEISNAYWEHCCKSVMEEKLNMSIEAAEPAATKILEQVRKHLPAKAFPSSPEACEYDPHQTTALNQPFIVIESLFQSQPEETEKKVEYSRILDDNWVLCHG